MWNFKYVKLESIIERIYRDCDHKDELNPADMAEWAGEAIELIGYPGSLITKVTNGDTKLHHPEPIDIVDYRGVLPDELYRVEAVREYESDRRMKLSTDVNHMDHTQPENSSVFTYTYQIKDKYIFTSFKEGKVVVTYLALPVSDCGLPLIPDNERYKQGVKAYIQEKVDYKLWRKGLLADKVYQKSEQERAWYIPSAQNSIQIPSQDEMQMIRNYMLRLVPKIDSWTYFNKYDNNYESFYNNSYARRNTT